MGIRKNPKQLSPVKRGQYCWDNPGNAIGRQGSVIDTSGEVWRLPNRGEYLFVNWNLVNAAPDVKDAMKAYVFHQIETKELEYAWTCFNHLKAVLARVRSIESLSDLTYHKLESIVAQMRLANDAWKFGHMRRWYRWGVEMTVPGMDAETLKRLNDLVIPSNTKGEAVLTRNPDRGPFTEEESYLLRSAVKNEAGTLVQRICVMISDELAIRPGQAVLLDEEDFKVTLINGEEHFTVDVVRLKQKTVGAPEKKRRRISQRLGAQIKLLIEENHSLYGTNEIERPIFRSRKLETAERLFNLPDADESGKSDGRMSRADFRYHMQEFAKSANIISPRTGRIITLFPYRFRYTFAIRHANQGTPPAVLAELLDHSTLDAVRIYTRSSSRSVDRLNDALGSNEEFTGIISRFLGLIVTRTGAEAPHTVIVGTTPTLMNLGGLGVCGAQFLCNLYPPLSCYVCPKFMAWKDGPHEEMLRELEIHEKNLSKRTGNPSDRIPKQLDSTQQAIVALLKKIKEGE
jgi:integrase